MGIPTASPLVVVQKILFLFLHHHQCIKIYSNVSITTIKIKYVIVCYAIFKGFQSRLSLDSYFYYYCFCMFLNDLIFFVVTRAYGVSWVYLYLVIVILIKFVLHINAVYVSIYWKFGNIFVFNPDHLSSFVNSLQTQA